MPRTLHIRLGKMKINIACFILIVLSGVTISTSIAQENEDVPKAGTEVETLKNRVSELEDKLKIVENVEKMELAAKLAEAQAKLNNTDIDKLKGELRESNNDWLRAWNNWFIGIVSVIALIIGAALWLVLKTLIEKGIKKRLDGFNDAIGKVKILSEELRMLKREYAASQLAEPDGYSEDDEPIYSHTVMTLSDETIIDVLTCKTYIVYVRIRAAELLKKRDPIQTLPKLIEFVDSLLDSGLYGTLDYPTQTHLRDILSLFKDIETNETYIGLGKILNRILSMEGNQELVRILLTMIIYSLAYVGTALNTGSLVHKMCKALPYLEVNIYDTKAFIVLIEYFDKFDKPAGIKEILTQHVTSEMSDLETQCLELLGKHDPDYVREWNEKKEANNTESE